MAGEYKDKLTPARLTSLGEQLRTQLGQATDPESTAKEQERLARASIKAQLAPLYEEMRRRIAERRRELEEQVELSMLEQAVHSATTKTPELRRDAAREFLNQVYRGHYGKGTLVVAKRRAGGDLTLQRVTLLGAKDPTGFMETLHHIRKCPVRCYVIDSWREYFCHEGVFLKGDYDAAVALVDVRLSLKEELDELWVHLRDAHKPLSEIRSAFFNTFTREKYSYEYSIGERYYAGRFHGRGVPAHPANDDGSCLCGNGECLCYLVYVAPGRWGFVSTSGGIRLYGVMADTEILSLEFPPWDREGVSFGGNWTKYLTRMIQYDTPNEDEVAVIQRTFGVTEVSIGPHTGEYTHQVYNRF